jgi:hypothetical protein
LGNTDVFYSDGFTFRGCGMELNVLIFTTKMRKMRMLEITCRWRHPSNIKNPFEIDPYFQYNYFILLISKGKSH